MTTRFIRDADGAEWTVYLGGYGPAQGGSSDSDLLAARPEIWHAGAGEVRTTLTAPQGEIEALPDSELLRRIHQQVRELRELDRR